jgi:hypothetical protein
VQQTETPVSRKTPEFFAFLNAEFGASLYDPRWVFLKAGYSVMNSATCIYCGQRFDPTRGEGDHVLQAAVFGEFRGDRTFRGICVPCNNEFGAFEQQLGQASPLGYLRNVVRPNRRRRGKQDFVVQRGTRGAPAPIHTMQLNGQAVLVHQSQDNPHQAIPVDQLVLVGATGSVRHVRLYRGMTAQRLRAEVAKTGIRDIADATFQCDAADADHFEALFASAFPASRIESTFTIEPGEMTLPGRIEFQFTADYFRALAKTALHYYLIHNQRGLNGHGRCSLR